MPPSGRKGKTRARKTTAPEPREASDVETPDAIATPSRSSRKRARASEAVAVAVPQRSTRRKTKDTRTNDREDTEGTEPQQQSDEETEPALPGEQEIVAHLKVASRHVNAVHDFANDLLEGQEHVPGYGKIAGRDWAFIIRKVEVNIGRPEQTDKVNGNGNGNGNGSGNGDGNGNSHAEGPTAETVVDIDLGPDRQVSRSHAIISYDPDSMQWFVVVNGRNGLRVDNNLLKRGMKTYLRNGSVIEIANTQMAFITTAAEDSDGPIWDASIIRQAQKSSEEDDEAEDETRARYRHAHPLARTNITDQNMYSSTADGQQQHRTHPHSQRAAMQAPPGTPMRPAQTFAKSSPAANYARGVMIESTETIDYAADNAKDLKPPHSYAQLIGMAILSTADQQMTLNNIYKWIMANYAFYRFNTGGWQNSIRHNLSLNKAFTKIARRTDEPGKGMKWMIEPTEFDNFVQQGMKGCRRPQPIPGTQSTLGSPHSPMHVVRTGVNGVKKDEEVTPPMINYQPLYPVANEAYTPERGPQGQLNGPLENGVGLGINGEHQEYDYITRSTPRNNGLNAIANAAGSPPALYVNDETRVGTLDTPFPLRPTQRFAPPSTLKRPSDFIQFSSPAPFWKMEGLVGSTPFKPYDLSPLKTPFPALKQSGEVHDDGEAESKVVDREQTQDSTSIDGESKEAGSPVVHSSSPPRLNSGLQASLEESPTLSRPATAVAKTLSQLAQADKADTNRALQHELSMPVNAGLPTAEQRRSEVNGSSAPMQPTPAASVAPSMAQALSTNGVNGMPPMTNGYVPALQTNGYVHTNGPANGMHMNGYHDDGDDEGIDLAK